MHQVKDCDGTEFTGMSALQLACFNRKLQMVDLLLADIQGIKTLNLRDRADQTALHILAFETDSLALELIKKLAKAGADLNILDRWGQTPLEIALFGRNLEVAQFLLTLYPKKLVEIARKCCQRLEFQNLPKVHEISLSQDPTAEQIQLFGSSLSYALKGERFGHECLPFEKTLVKFEAPSEHFHANHVFDGLGIAAYAPIEENEAIFWKMIWDNHANAIVQLTNIPPSYSDYLLDGKYGNLTVKVIEAEMLFSNDQQHFVKKVMQVTDGNTTKVITHWNVMNWPDASVIPPKFLAKVVKVIAGEILEGNIKKLVAHCMAGIGRTGTFYTTLKAYLDHQKGDTSYNLVYRTAVQLRNERHGSIQTEEQYQLIHEALDLLKDEIATDIGSADKKAKEEEKESKEETKKKG